MRRQGGGSIVNVSSGTALFTPSGTGGYAATKAALNMLSAVARAELAGDGIVESGDEQAVLVPQALLRR